MSPFGDLSVDEGESCGGEGAEHVSHVSHDIVLQRHHGIVELLCCD